MANALSDITTKTILITGGPHKIYTAQSDGTIQAGAMCGMETGVAVATDLGGANAESFMGIAEHSWEEDEDIDTAITSGLDMTLMVPQGGKVYGCLISNPGTAVQEGTPFGFSANAGALVNRVSITATGIVAYADKDIANGDTYAKMRWA